MCSKPRLRKINIKKLKIDLTVKILIKKLVKKNFVNRKNFSVCLTAYRSILKTQKPLFYRLYCVFIYVFKNYIKSFNFKINLKCVLLCCALTTKNHFIRF